MNHHTLVLGSVLVGLELCGLGAALALQAWLRPCLPRRLSQDGKPWRTWPLWFVLWHGIAVLLYVFKTGTMFRAMSFLLLVLFYIALLGAVGRVLLCLVRLFRLPERRMATVWRLTAPLLLLVIALWGWYAAYYPRVVHYRVVLDKPMTQPLRVLVVSDLHLGRWIGNAQLDKLEAIAQAERPDVVLIAGDLVDDVPDIYLRDHMGRHLQRLRAPLGVYAVLGNHDNYRQVQGKIVGAFEQAGVKVLRDESALVGGRFWLVGRRDDNEARLPLRELMSAHIAASPLPVLVLDHEPTQVAANAQTAMDVQISGHTHGGQIFPGTVLIHLFQDYVYGRYAVNGKTVIVSSGYGLWGIPLRIGARAEAVVVEIEGRP